MPWVQDCYGRNHSSAPTGRGLRWSLVQPSVQAGSALSSDQVTQDFIQSGLKNFQGRRWFSLSGQPVPVLGYPYSEAVFPYQSEPLLLQLTSFSLILPSRGGVKSLALLPLFSTDLRITAPKLWRRKIKENTSNISNLKMLSLLRKPAHA